MAEVKKETARGRYKQKECPYCHEPKGNLANHIRLKHPTEAPAPPPAPELTKEKLLGQEPKETAPPPALAPGNTIYKHSCRAELRYGESECWNCGESLNWEGINQ